MTGRSIAEYLTRFDAPDDVQPALDLCADIIPTPIWKQELQEDREAVLAEAREEGKAAGVEEARIEFAAALEAEREASEQRLAAAREEWLREEAEQLREQLVTALRSMEESIGECVARVLRPFLIESLRRQMLDDLIDHIATMIGSNEKIALRIAGPPDLLAALRAKLATVPAAIEYEPQERVDISVTAEQTAIETQLEAWINMIAAETG